MQALRQKTEENAGKIRILGYDLQEKWEHEFLKDKREDADLRRFLETHETEDRLEPRESFYGGRTNAIKLYYEGVAKYVDFTSLYPWVNFTDYFLKYTF